MAKAQLIFDDLFYGIQTLNNNTFKSMEGGFLKRDNFLVSSGCREVLDNNNTPDDENQE